VKTCDTNCSWLQAHNHSRAKTHAHASYTIRIQYIVLEMTPSTGRSEHRMLKSEFEMTEYELKDVETEIGGAHEVKETEDEVDEDEYGDEELVAIPGRYVESRKKNENSSSHLEQILAKEAKLPPWWKIGGVGGVFLAVIGLSILRTTSECGSTAYW